MIVYSLLFTLKDKNPKENKYINMFYIWISYIIRNGGLNEEDTICILCDEKTLEQLNSNELLSNLVDMSNSNFEIHLIKQPENISQGMCERYKFKKENELVFFLDVDVLVKGNIKEYFSNVPNENEYILAVPEGKLIDTNYAGELIEKNEHIEKHPGFTSGIFGYKWGEGVCSFMKTVTENCLQREKEPLYTIDQPFFNKEIYNTMYNQITLKHKVFLIDEKIIENNPDLRNESKSGIFINYCGDPGNDTIHFNKILLDLCFRFITKN